MGQGHARSGGAHHPQGSELAALFSKRWREEAKDAEHISTAAAAEVVHRIAADLHLALTKEEIHAWTASLGSGVTRDYLLKMLHDYLEKANFILSKHQLRTERELIVEYLKETHAYQSSYLSLLPPDLTKKLDQLLVRLPGDTKYAAVNLWTHAAPCDPLDMHLIGCHVVFACSASGEAEALDLQSGKSIWKCRPQKQLTRIAVLAEGLVVAWAKDQVYFYRPPLREPVADTTLIGPILGLCALGHSLYAAVIVGNEVMTVLKLTITLEASGAVSVAKARVGNLPHYTDRRVPTTATVKAYETASGVIVTVTQPSVRLGEHDYTHTRNRQIHMMDRDHADWAFPAYVVHESGSVVENLTDQAISSYPITPASEVLSNGSVLLVRGAIFTSSNPTITASLRALSVVHNEEVTFSDVKRCGPQESEIAILHSTNSKSDLYILDATAKKKRVMRTVSAVPPPHSRAWCVHGSLLLIGDATGVLHGVEVTCSLEVLTAPVCKGPVQWVHSLGDFILTASAEGVACWRLKVAHSPQA